MKPKYRYNWKTKEWEETYRVRWNQRYIEPSLARPYNPKYLYNKALEDMYKPPNLVQPIHPNPIAKPNGDELISIISAFGWVVFIAIAIVIACYPT